MPNFLQRIASALVSKAAGEGEVRPGPYYLPVTGGWLPADAPWNFWQSGIDPSSGASSAMVEACLSAYSQTIAMCPGDHWRLNDKNGRDRVGTSALSRILRYPNSYQSPSDFMLNLTRSLYADGNAYALALRNDRYEISELHLMDPRQSLSADRGDRRYLLHARRQRHHRPADQGAAARARSATCCTFACTRRGGGIRSRWSATRRSRRRCRTSRQSNAMTAAADPVLP